MAKSRARKNNASTRSKEHSYAMDSETVRQRQEHKRGNAAGTHLDRRTKRARTRAASKHKAISSGW